MEGAIDVGLRRAGSRGVSRHVAAATEVQAIIGSEIGVMTAAWAAAATEADELEGQCAAISAVVGDYKEKLARFCRSIYYALMRQTRNKR